MRVVGTPPGDARASLRRVVFWALARSSGARRGCSQGARVLRGYPPALLRPSRCCGVLRGRAAFPNTRDVDARLTPTTRAMVATSYLPLSSSEPPRASRGSTPSAGPLSSSCVSGSGARYRPLPDQIPLALCGGAEQVEGQLAPGGAGLDALGQGPERHPAPVEVTDDVDQVAQRPPEPVRPPHGDAVSDAQRLHHGVEGRAMLWLPGDPVDEDLVAAGCRQGVLLQGPGLARGWRRGRSRSGTWCSDSHYSARDQVRRR